MPRQGEVYQRADSERPLLVVVASGSVFNSASTGMTFVCPVLTTIAGDEDYAVWLPFDLPVQGSDERVRGVVVPERVYLMPTAALGARPLVRLPDPMVQRLRATIQSLFE